MILGINCDDVLGNPNFLLDTLSGFKTRPVLGIVCNPDEPASLFVQIAQRLSSVADILWRPFDSSSLMHRGRPRYNTTSYEARTEEFATTLGKFCGANGGIECGNEITLPPHYVGPGISYQVRGAIERCTAHQIKSFVCYFFDADHPLVMSDLARHWGLRPAVDMISIYPNTYGNSDWNLDSAFNGLEAALPGSPKMIGEFGSEDGQGQDTWTLEQHLSLVEGYLAFRPANKDIKYQLGGFEWDWMEKTLASEKQREFYQNLGGL